MTDNTIQHKTITVETIPTMQTLIRHCWARPFPLESMEKDEFVLTWKWTHVFDYLRRKNIEPKGYIHSRHSHMPHQMASPERLELLDTEFKRRGLEAEYSLFIEIQTGEASEK